MYSWLVTVLLLASAAYSSRSQGAVGWECVCVFDNYVCTEYIDAWIRCRMDDVWCILMLHQLVYQLICDHFPCRCTSAHHKLHLYTT